MIIKVAQSCHPPISRPLLQICSRCYLLDRQNKSKVTWSDVPSGLMGGHRDNLEVSFETGNPIVSWPVMVRSQHPSWCQLPLVMYRTLRSGTHFSRHCLLHHWQSLDIVDTLTSLRSGDFMSVRQCVLMYCDKWTIKWTGLSFKHNRWLENISVLCFLMLFPRLFHVLAVAHVKWVSAEEEAWT